jgi:hypothetical protein
MFGCAARAWFEPGGACPELVETGPFAVDEELDGTLLVEVDGR